MAARVSPLLLGASPQYAWRGAYLQAPARAGALSAGFACQNAADTRLNKLSSL